MSGDSTGGAASGATSGDRGGSTPTQPSPLEGEGEAIANAVRDHYKPQGPADTVPTAPLTVAVALADKLDTLVGFFAIDEKPTGSKDPYALRRAALGVIRLVLENGVRIPLLQTSLRWIAQFNLEQSTLAMAEAEREALSSIGQLSIGNELNHLVERARSFAEAELYAPQGRRFWSVPNEVLAFFADRLTVLLRDQGQRHDLVAAVFALGDDDLVRIVRRVEALAAFLATDDGANLLAGYKRASNILKAEEKKGPLPTGMVQTGLPGQPEEETTLAFAAAAASTAVDAALAAEDFAAAMRALAALRAPVDAFFDKVMVNSDVPAERENRLKLLGQIRAVMGRVADFAQIAG